MALKVKKCIIAAVVVFTIVFSFLLVSLICNGNISNASSKFSLYYNDSSYLGGEFSTTDTETINYATKNEQVYSINPSFPEYYNISSLSNTCANVAAANILGYYDRYYDNLIPNSTAGMLRGDTYIYFPMSYQQEGRQYVINTLYTLMGTNTENSGTSHEQYRNGMNSYVSSCGRNVSYSSVMNEAGINVSAVINALDNGLPMIVFLSGYNISVYSTSDGYDTWIKKIYSGNHMMAVYGMKTISYYDELGTLIASRTIFYVSTGFSTERGIYVLNNNGAIIEAESVNIY